MAERDCDTAEGDVNASPKKCIFCDIIAQNDPAKIVKQGEKFVIVKDIHPVATHHFLVLSRDHIATAKSLQPTPKDRELLDCMYGAAKQVLLDNGVDTLSNSRFGFHWPPFYSVGHLHLHAISPVSSMAWYCRYIQFNTTMSFCFVDVNYVRKRIGCIVDKTEESDCSIEKNKL
ncbi:adenosine 5'-monophosphoramidase HINT3-like [Adelges cooleyi]|uniref:adenosine 5'-monophosphoramidase HINT3-like n=1 Tax=Adelges cooleyi TaxID=133065 RepID=UPI00217F9FA6|nr:adenosine 5'-monophosphoramidase HINT3-like [Adelges cooleyi]